MNSEFRHHVVHLKIDLQSVGLSNLLSLSRHSLSMLSEAFLLSTRDRVSLRPAKGSSAPLSCDRSAPSPAL
ncbi:hypothetical protein H6G96_27240 [Nostoc sp. FACHB-892]|nr:hypothetical protein [Nostoc sp. FACHB-892]